MTPREQQLIAALEQLSEARGFRPTLRELSQAIGVSVARVHQLVVACERRGWITRNPGLARTYRLSREEPSHA